MDVFDELAKQLNVLPEKIQQAYEKSTIEQIDETAEKMKKNLERGSTSGTALTLLASRLNDNMVEDKVYIKGKYYERTIDWDDNKIVDEDLGIKWGKYKDKPRARKKRNYSLRPATYHDLAYIINYGRGANFSQESTKIVAGNYFINKATRNAKNWRKKRDKKFNEELRKIGKNLE